MNPFLLGPILEVGKTLIDRFMPDPAAKAEAQLELLKMQQAGDFKELDAALQVQLAQIAVNQAEAQSENLFKAGWRPAVGWICAAGLFYQVMGAPLAGWILVNTVGWSAPPALEGDTLMTLLFGLLGLGTFRTYEKIKAK